MLRNTYQLSGIEVEPDAIIYPGLNPDPLGVPKELLSWRQTPDLDPG